MNVFCMPAPSESYALEKMARSRDNCIDVRWKKAFPGFSIKHSRLSQAVYNPAVCNYPRQWRALWNANKGDAIAVAGLAHQVSRPESRQLSLINAAGVNSTKWPAGELAAFISSFRDSVIHLKTVFFLPRHVPKRKMSQERVKIRFLLGSTD